MESNLIRIADALERIASALERFWPVYVAPTPVYQPPYINPTYPTCPPSPFTSPTTPYVSNNGNTLVLGSAPLWSSGAYLPVSDVGAGVSEPYPEQYRGESDLANYRARGCSGDPA
jgi:hypothetical protein